MSDYEEPDYDEDEEDDDMNYDCHKSLPVADLEEGKTLLSQFLLDNQCDIAWGLITKIGDDYHLHTRWNQPCYGEMRPYGKTHPELLPVSQRKVNKPGDLTSPFPDGTPVTLGVSLYFVHSDVSLHNRVLNYFLDPEFSPWRNVLKDFSVVKYGEENRIVGLILNDLNIDPTLMVNLFMTLRSLNDGSFADDFLGRLEKLPDENPYLVLASMFAARLHRKYIAGTSWNNGKYADPEYYLAGTWTYYIAPDLNVKNFLKGVTDPTVSEGGTFAERFAYNRPQLHNIFGKTGTSIQKMYISFAEKEGITLDSTKQYTPIDTLPKIIECLKQAAA